jgi:2-polyprenyl-3-methyl-5-hydroxy-6-metoxy-1,4-benzoquinol methylase
MRTLEQEGRLVRLREEGGRTAVEVFLDPASPTPDRHCTTSYPDDLIERLLEVKGAAWLCDEIQRDESPHYVQRALENGLLGFVAPEDFEGARLLDFGSGSGASCAVLCRLFPRTRVVGVELVPEFVELAERRIRHHGFQERVSLHLSPDPSSLPSDLGEFDFVSFSAVFEHLLPHEQAPILKQVWQRLKPGGTIFINQTPNRWSVAEYHTTGGLPLLNYLPDALVGPAARRLSGRCRGLSWERLLRGGIRGSTPGAIVAMIRGFADGHEPQLLPLRREQARNDIELWFQSTSLLSARNARLKRLIRAAAYLSWPLRRFVLPTIILAIRKGEPQGT